MPASQQSCRNTEFSTIRAADRVYILDGGRITACGSFDELSAPGGPLCPKSSGPNQTAYML
jgi:ABC-type multidrug transport system ATPase subunit